MKKFQLQSFNGSPEEGSPMTVPVFQNFLPLKEVNIRMVIKNEDGEVKPTDGVDVNIAGCILGRDSHVC